MSLFDQNQGAFVTGGSSENVLPAMFMVNPVRHGMRGVTRTTESKTPQNTLFQQVPQPYVSQDEKEFTFDDNMEDYTFISPRTPKVAEFGAARMDYTPIIQQPTLIQQSSEELGNAGWIPTQQDPKPKTSDIPLLFKRSTATMEIDDLFGNGYSTVSPQAAESYGFENAISAQILDDPSFLETQEEDFMIRSNIMTTPITTPIPAPLMADYRSHSGSPVQSIGNTYLMQHQLNPSDSVREWGLGGVISDQQVYAYSRDHNGSKQLQNWLDTATPAQIHAVFSQIFRKTLSLSLHVFGNYIIQKLFEHGSPEHHVQLSAYLKGNMLRLSKHLYGCRVVQKALDTMDQSLSLPLVQELEGHEYELVFDENSNHVMQKIIEVMPMKHLPFIANTFASNVDTIGVSAYGARLVQRLLSFGTTAQKAVLLSGVCKHFFKLASDQFGNYIIQHVLEKEAPVWRKQFVQIIGQNLLHLSTDKYSSHIPEKAFLHADDLERQILLHYLMGINQANPPLSHLVGDKYGNFVVTKALEAATKAQREALIVRLRQLVPNLEHSTYGRHIAGTIARLSNRR